MLSGNVFLTGGAGFLGRGLLRRALTEHWPASFTVWSRDDSKHAALMRRFPNVRCIRGDIAGDRDALAAALRGHETVVHMAAVKYVDLAESNAIDTVRVNIHGSENVAWAAQTAGVARVVAISTDKAALPVNVYGLSKAVMERVMIEADRLAGPDGTRFTVCRYGNVVGSTGSVIPLFKHQLASTGRVKVTSLAMTRFWMSVDEAIDCILVALRQPGGSTVIPRPRAMRLADLVHAVTQDMGLVDVVGLRPGEKLDELLVHRQESVCSSPLGNSPEWDGPKGWSGLALSPPGVLGYYHGANDGNGFEWSSADPLGGWMTPDEMLALIVEAETI